jgi:hypothetical protein
VKNRKKGIKVNVKLHQTVVGAGGKTRTSTHTFKVNKKVFDQWGKGFSVKAEPKWDEIQDRLLEITIMCRKSAEMGATNKEEYIRERLTTKLLETAVLLDEVINNITVCVQFQVPKETKEASSDAKRKT